MKNTAFIGSLALLLSLIACGNSDPDSPSETGGAAGSAGAAGVAGASAGAAGSAGSTAGSAGAAGDAAGSAGAAGSAAGSAGAAGAPDPMGCTAQITDAAGSNVGVMSFSAPSGILGPQGSGGTQKDGTIAFGVHALQSVPELGGAVQLRIDLVGAAPTPGATYATKADLGTSIDNTPNYLGFGVPNGSEGADWIADAGTVVTVTAVGPGPLSNYKMITFTFSGAHMSPVTLGGDKATGTFTMSGSCYAAIQFK